MGKQEFFDSSEEIRPMKALNDLIKSFDHSDNHIELIQNALLDVMKKGMPIVQMKFHKGRAVYRCRKNNSLNEKYFFESDISFRTDINRINKIGRCNFFNSSKFYGSISSPDIDLGYATSVFETSGLLRDDTEGREIYTLGMWEAIEDVELFAVKPTNNSNKEIKIVKELLEVFQTNLEDSQQEVIEFYELLGHEMSKPVSSGNENNYLISTLLSEVLLQTQTGIVYPSVQSESKGLNVVFNPKIFNEHFVLKRVLIGELFKFKTYPFFRNLMICENASLFPFKYHNCNPSDTASLEQVINYYNQNGIPSKMIISSLLSQTT